MLTQASKGRQIFEVSVNREPLPASTTSFVHQMPAFYQPSPYTGQYVGFVHVPGPERIVQVPVEVPVERIVEVPVYIEVQVPGPERIVEVPGPERVVVKEIPPRRLCGVGLALTRDTQNRCVVEQVLPGGPSDGVVHEGDIILEIDNMPTERIPEGEAAKCFLGEEFTLVTLTLTSDRIYSLTSNERRVGIKRRPFQAPGTT